MHGGLENDQKCYLKGDGFLLQMYVKVTLPSLQKLIQQLQLA